METVTDTPITPEPVETPATPEEPTSIAEHAASFSPEVAANAEPKEGETVAEAIQRERDDKGRYRTHSQRARAEDVDEINALTKTLRTKEEELRKTKPEALAGTPRLIALKRQIKAIEADLAEAAAPAKAEPAKQSVREAVKPSPGSFDEKEPKFEDFANEPDQYLAHIMALVKYTQKQEEFDAAQARATEEQSGRRREAIEGYQRRVTEFSKTAPDFAAVTKSLIDQSLPNLLLVSLISDDNGPAHVYHLAQHPELVDELFLLTDGKPVTDSHVATVQRRVRQHAQAATTGSAAVARTTYQPPRPPNPVRTGPITTANDPPDEASSISDHAKYFGPKRR